MGRKKLDIDYVKQIIPLIEKGNTLKDLAYVLGKSEPTIWRWVGELRARGYKIKIKQGRPRKEDRKERLWS